jgi:ATP-dependent DNA ligase
MRPMLAHTYTPNAKTSSRAYKMPFPCYVQPKLDGIRCISHIRHDGTVILESRKGTEFVYLDHIRNAIKQLYDEWTDRPQKLHLDGELYTDKLPFEAISGLVRQKKENRKSIEQDLVQMQKIHYHVYDVYDPENPDMSFQDRRQILEQILTQIVSKPLKEVAKFPITAVYTEQSVSQTDLKEKHDKYVAEGYEGIMLRDPIGPYESNKRSKFLQKYKEFMEEEFRIVGYHDGEGIDEGLVIWECALNADPAKTFSVKPRGTHEYRRDLYDQAEQYIGQLLTVIFQEYSADGVPRFPVGKSIRTDI